MKVLHMRSSPFFGSPEKLLVERLRTAGGTDDDVVCVIDEQPGTGNDFLSELREIGIRTYGLSGRAVSTPANLLRLVKILKKEGPDIVSTNDYKSNILGLLASRAAGTPVTATFHGKTRTSRKMALYHRIDSMVLKKFDSIVFVSRKSMEDNRFLEDESRMFVVHNALDPLSCGGSGDDAGAAGPVVMEEHWRGSGMRVVFAGRLSREKGLEYLVDSVRRLKDDGVAMNLFVFGDGPERSALEKRISSCGLHEDIFLMGYRRDLGPYLRGADILVLPSLSEGLPLIVLEAFGWGVPVVATEVGGLPEIIEHGENGILVPPGDSASLAEGIRTLIENEGYRRQLAAGALKCLCEKFSVARQREQFEIAYRRTLELARGRLPAH